MPRVQTSDLRPGAVVSRSVRTPAGELLVPCGTRVDEGVRAVLAQWGISEVYVRPSKAAAGAGETAAHRAAQVPEAVAQAYAQAVASMAEAMERVRRAEPVDLRALGVDCGQAALLIAEEPEVVSYLHLLDSGHDYTFQHSIRVGVLTALLARWLGLSSTDRSEAAIAGVLHDVGKARVPQEILDKPGPLSPAELEAARAHSLSGHELLRPAFGTASPPARVALEHHERVDGSGYPRGLRGSQCLLASRIVAIADVYDAMTSDRVYRDRQPEHAALSDLLESGFSRLDPRLARVFVERLVYRTLGRLVRLSNGQVGRVVFVHRTAPGRPILAVGGTLVDLRREPGLSLTEEVLLA